MTNEPRNLAGNAGDDALAAAVDGAYLAFRRHAGSARPLDICSYCCVAKATARRLEELPPERLTPDDFYEYNSSAKSDVQRADEVGHFLPRMLASLARGEEIHHSLDWSEERYVNAFADDRPEFLQQVHDWLLDAACRARFAERLTRADFLAMAEGVRDAGCMSFVLMTETVFDHLTR